MSHASSLFLCLLLVAPVLAQEVKPVAPAEMTRLLDGLGSDNVRDRVAAATVLEAAVKDPLLPIRARAALGLARIDRKYVPQARPILQQALADKDIDIRFHAASALLELNVGQQAAVLDALTALFKDPD